MSFLSNERIPFRLALSLTAGTTSWDSVPYSDRWYYQNGSRGGGLPPERETSFDAEEADWRTTVFDDSVYDKQVEMYCDALESAAAAAGCPVVAREVEVTDAEVAALIGGSLEETFQQPVLQNA